MDPQLFVNTENGGFCKQHLWKLNWSLRSSAFVVHFSAYICFVARHANFGSHAGLRLALILPNERLRMYFYSDVLILSPLKFIKLSCKT